MHGAKGKPAVRAQEQRQQKSSSLQPYPFPGTAWEKEHETLHLQHALHVRKGDLTSAGPAAAKIPHAKGERGSTPPSGSISPHCLSFPFCKAGCPTSPFLKPSGTEPAPSMSQAQASVICELTHSRGAQRQVFHALKK